MSLASGDASTESVPTCAKLRFCVPEPHAWRNASPCAVTVDGPEGPVNHDSSRLWYRFCGRRRRVRKISRGLSERERAQPPVVENQEQPHPESLRGVLDTSSGCRFLSCRRIPGVREKRVPLANFLAPLRGAGFSCGFSPPPTFVISCATRHAFVCLRSTGNSGDFWYWFA